MVLNSRKILKSMTVKNKIRVISIVIILSWSMLLGCGKCSNSSKVTYPPINEEFSKYFLSYQDGSYWIYADSLTGEKETMRLTDFYREYKFREGCFKEDVASYHLSFEPLSSFPIHGRFTGGSNSGGVFSIPKDRSFKRFSFGIEKGKFISGISDTAVFHNEYLIKNTHYEKVIEFQLPEGHQIQKCFLAPNIGIIKWIIDNKTYELFDYEIQN